MSVYWDVCLWKFMDEPYTYVRYPPHHVFRHDYLHCMRRTRDGTKASIQVQREETTISDDIRLRLTYKATTTRRRSTNKSHQNFSQRAIWILVELLSEAPRFINRSSYCTSGSRMMNICEAGLSKLLTSRFPSFLAFELRQLVCVDVFFIIRVGPFVLRDTSLDGQNLHSLFYFGVGLVSALLTTYCLASATSPQGA